MLGCDVLASYPRRVFLGLAPLIYVDIGVCCLLLVDYMYILDPLWTSD